MTLKWPLPCTCFYHELFNSRQSGFQAPPNLLVEKTFSRKVIVEGDINYMGLLLYLVLAYPLWFLLLTPEQKVEGCKCDAPQYNVHSPMCSTVACKNHLMSQFGSDRVSMAEYSCDWMTCQLKTGSLNWRLSPLISHWPHWHHCWW